MNSGCKPACSFDQRFPLRAHHCHPERVQCVVVVHSHNRGGGQHWIIRSDMRGVLGGLFDRLHLFFATGVVERTNDDGLPEEDVSCGA